jgi:hypothetical protein
MRELYAYTCDTCGKPAYNQSLKDGIWCFHGSQMDGIFYSLISPRDDLQQNDVEMICDECVHFLHETNQIKYKERIECEGCYICGEDIECFVCHRFYPLEVGNQGDHCASTVLQTGIWCHCGSHLDGNYYVWVNDIPENCKELIGTKKNVCDKCIVEMKKRNEIVYKLWTINGIGMEDGYGEDYDHEGKCGCENDCIEEYIHDDIECGICHKFYPLEIGDQGKKCSSNVFKKGIFSYWGSDFDTRCFIWNDIPENCKELVGTKKNVCDSCILKMKEKNQFSFITTDDYFNVRKEFFEENDED